MKIMMVFLAVSVMLIVVGVYISMNNALSLGSALVALGASCAVMSFNSRRQTKKKNKVNKK